MQQLPINLSIPSTMSSDLAFANLPYGYGQIETDLMGKVVEPVLESLKVFFIPLEKHSRLEGFQDVASFRCSDRVEGVQHLLEDHGAFAGQGSDAIIDAAG